MSTEERRHIVEAARYRNGDDPSNAIALLGMAIRDSTTFERGRIETAITQIEGRKHEPSPVTQDELARCLRLIQQERDSRRVATAMRQELADRIDRGAVIEPGPLSAALSERAGTLMIARS